MRPITFLMAAAAMSVAALAPLSAQAFDYGVVATATSSAGNVYENGGQTCSYNGSVGSCAGGQGHYGGSSSGTVSPSGPVSGATSATATTSAEGADATANSRTNADLATASLHLYGADTGQTANVSSQGAPFGSTGGYASLKDTLHFTVLGASADTVTTVTAIFTLDGRMIGGSSDIDTPNTSSGELFGRLNFANVPSRFDLKNNASTGFATTADLDNYPAGLADSTWTTNVDHTVNISTFTFNVIGPSTDFNFFLEASLQCSTGFTCDFANTAKFALSLPTNVSFTSDSGVFLAGAATPPAGVPEPASWALMLVGFMGLGAGLRARRRSAATA